MSQFPSSLKGLTDKRKNPNHAFEQLKWAAAQARLPFDRDTWTNVAFYLNEQYVEWAQDVSTLRRVPREERFLNTPRPVANKIMHFCNQSHASALQDEPTVDVLPATDDPIALADTEVMNGYLTWLADPMQTNFVAGPLAEATLWAVVAGEGYLKWVYNPRLKRPDILPCGPLDIYPDPYALRFDQCRYVIHSQFMDVEQVYDIWGKEVKPNETAQADPVRSKLLQQMGTAPVLSGVIVNEMWMKPSRRYPNGLYVVWTRRDRLVDPQDFPYDHGQLPFTQIGVIRRPGSMHYSSAAKYMISGQMELNKYHAQRIMIREAFANPKWWIPAELDLEQPPDDSPRQILTGQSQGGNIKPEIISPAQMADNQEGNWITEELMHIVGLHEVSQAQVPGRVEAAKAISLLKEADVSRLWQLNQTIKSAISQGYMQVLKLAAQYVDDNQILVTYSREGMPEVQRWRKEAVKPGTQVRVTMGTGLASSRAARQDQLLLLWQNGIIQDPTLMARLMDVPIPTFVVSDAFDMRLARNENLEMAKGIAITPNSWDNHQIHLREHNDFRKTHEFLLLPQETKQKFEYHCQTHDVLFVQVMGKQIQQAQMAQAAAQASQGGAPPPGPGGPPPGGPGGQPSGGPQEKAMFQDRDAFRLAQGPGDALGHRMTHESQ